MPGILLIEEIVLKDYQVAEDVINRINEICGVDIRERTRKRNYIDGRCVAAKIMVDIFRITLMDVGDYLIYGKALNHATVIHSILSFEKLMESDSAFKSKFGQVYKFYKDRKNEYRNKQRVRNPLEILN